MRTARDTSVAGSIVRQDDRPGPSPRADNTANHAPKESVIVSSLFLLERLSRSSQLHLHTHISTYMYIHPYIENGIAEALAIASVPLSDPFLSGFPTCFGIAVILEILNARREARACNIITSTKGRRCREVLNVCKGRNPLLADGERAHACLFRALDAALEKLRH